MRFNFVLFSKLVQFSRVQSTRQMRVARSKFLDRAPFFNSVQEVYRQGGMIDDRRVATCGP